MAQLVEDQERSMTGPHWDNVEWDEENKKNGNIQHLRDHGIEPDEAEECFFHEYFSRGIRVDLMMSMFWTEELIEGDDYDSFFKTRVRDSRESLRVGR